MRPKQGHRYKHVAGRQGEQLHSFVFLQPSLIIELGDSDGLVHDLKHSLTAEGLFQQVLSPVCIASTDEGNISVT